MRVLVACLNFTATALDGGKVGAAGDPDELVRLLDDTTRAERWEQAVPYYERKAVETGTIEARSDYAAALLRVGRTDEAIAMLEALEAEQAGTYTVAANLGTAYELAGRPDDALVWINRAIEINPRSHEGSEWVHVEILEAEIALREDPHWLEKNSVLGFDFGDEGAPRMPVLSERFGSAEPELLLDHLLLSITWQLKERMPLVPPPNAIVADLLVDLAALQALEEGLEFAVPSLELAQRYGTARPELVEARLAHHRPLVAVTARERLVGQLKFGFVCFAAFAAWVGGGTWVFVRVARRVFG